MVLLHLCEVVALARVMLDRFHKEVKSFERDAFDWDFDEGILVILFDLLHSPLDVEWANICQVPDVPAKQELEGDETDAPNVYFEVVQSFESDFRSVILDCA